MLGGVFWYLFTHVSKQRIGFNFTLEEEENKLSRNFSKPGPV
jgi:hypothetical protein